MGSSHADCSQACDAVAGGSSALPVITSDVHSVPVLVSGKKIEQVRITETPLGVAGVGMGIVAIKKKL